jgi:hypothetical protein
MRKSCYVTRARIAQRAPIARRWLLAWLLSLGALASARAAAGGREEPSPAPAKSREASGDRASGRASVREILGSFASTAERKIVALPRSALHLLGLDQAHLQLGLGHMVSIPGFVQANVTGDLLAVGKRVDGNTTAATNHARSMINGAVFSGVWGVDGALFYRAANSETAADKPRGALRRIWHEAKRHGTIAG